MGRILNMIVEDLRALGPDELAELGRQVDLVFPGSWESPGAHFLASLRDALADQIEQDGCAPEPDGITDIPPRWDLIPHGRAAWNIFLDLEAFRTTHARRHHLTTDGVRMVLDKVGGDFWVELLVKHVPTKFYA